MADSANHVVLWFGDSADVDCLQRIQQLRDRYPAVVCLLVRTADAEALRQLVAHRATGIGVILRDSQLSTPDLVRVLLQLVGGRVAMTPSVLEELLATRTLRMAPIESLAPAEHDVLALLALGYRNREIARRMAKSEKFVERRIARIFDKLQLNGRSAGSIDRRVVAARLFLLRSDGSARGSP
jgi:DNA-binding NarL/FixJ family response regulator